MEKKKWLKEGKQTKTTPYVKNLASSFKKEGLNYIAEILSWIKGNLRPKEGINDTDPCLFSRTAEEIVKSGYLIGGCAGEGIVFVTLARAKGIPASYIQAAYKESLIGEINLKGHVFSKILIDEKVFLVDPSKSTIADQEDFGDYIPIAEGLDSLDIGVRNVKDLRNLFQKYKVSGPGGN